MGQIAMLCKVVCSDVRNTTFSEQLNKTNHTWWSNSLSEISRLFLHMAKC